MTTHCDCVANDFLNLGYRIVAGTPGDNCDYFAQLEFNSRKPFVGIAGGGVCHCSTCKSCPLNGTVAVTPYKNKMLFCTCFSCHLRHLAMKKRGGCKGNCFYCRGAQPAKPKMVKASDSSDSSSDSSSEDDEELEELKAELEAAKKKLVEQVVPAAAVDAERDAKEQELREKLSAKNARITQLQEEVAALKEEIEAQKQNVIDAESSAERVGADLDKEREENASLKARLEEHENAVAGGDAQIRVNLEQQIAALKEQLDGEDGRRSELKAELGLVSGKNLLALKNEMEKRYGVELDAMQRSMESDRGVMEQSKEQIAAMRADLQARDEQLEQMRAELKGLRALPSFESPAASFESPAPGGGAAFRSPAARGESAAGSPSSAKRLLFGGLDSSRPAKKANTSKTLPTQGHKDAAAEEVRRKLPFRNARKK